MAGRPRKGLKQEFGEILCQPACPGQLCCLGNGIQWVLLEEMLGLLGQMGSVQTASQPDRPGPRGSEGHEAPCLVSNGGMSWQQAAPCLQEQVPPGLQ